MISVELPYPPSANRLWRAVNGRQIKSKPYREWLTEAGWSLKLAKPVPVLGEYRLRLYVDRPDRRRRDLDNLAKATMDALKASGVIEDDCLAKSILMTWTDAPPKAPGRMVVELEAA